MGIVAEIAQCMFRAAEWSFGVNDPVMAEQQFAAKAKAKKTAQPAAKTANKAA
jgi:hypothetical protein